MLIKFADLKHHNWGHSGYWKVWLGEEVIGEIVSDKGYVTYEHSRNCHYMGQRAENILYVSPPGLMEKDEMVQVLEVNS